MVKNITCMIGIVIPAGTTKTIYVKADTSASTKDQTYQLMIESIGDLSWSDGTSNVTTLTKELPLYGGTLTY